MTPLVTIHNLTVTARTPRGTAHILRGIDLVIGKGRILGVVGESGSGKSTLALALLRLLPPNVDGLRGQMLMGGHDLVALPRIHPRPRVARHPPRHDLPGPGNRS